MRWAEWLQIGFIVSVIGAVVGWAVYSGEWWLVIELGLELLG